MLLFGFYRPEKRQFSNTYDEFTKELVWSARFATVNKTSKYWWIPAATFYADQPVAYAEGESLSSNKVKNRKDVRWNTQITLLYSLYAVNQGLHLLWKVFHQCKLCSKFVFCATVLQSGKATMVEPSYQTG